MIAGAPAVPGAAGTTARLALAVAASTLVHALVLAGGGLDGELGLDGFMPGATGRNALYVTLPPVARGAGPAPGGAERPRPGAPAAAAGTGPVPAPKYHRAAELDQRPQIRVHVEPQFPALALAPTGRVVLRLYVNEAGEVDEVAVESADATGAFAEAARKAFAGARYYPGVKDGKPVKSLVRIEVLFGLPPPPAAAATFR